MSKLSFFFFDKYVKIELTVKSCSLKMNEGPRNPGKCNLHAKQVKAMNSYMNLEWH